MSEFIDLHGTFYNTILLLMLILAVWGLFLALARRKVPGGYRSTFALAIAAFVIQDIIGIVIFVTIHQPKEMSHLIYGLVPVLALGLALSFSGDQPPRREALILGGTALFLFVMILIRAKATGQLA